MSDGAPLTRSHRIQHIVELMQAGQWTRGATGRALAFEWGVEPATVRDYAATAWSILKARAGNVAEVQADVATILRRDIERASSEGRYSDVAKTADVLTRILGARAPERTQEVPVSPEDAVKRWEELTGTKWQGGEK